MFLYGIRLVLQDSITQALKPDQTTELDFGLIANLLNMSFSQQKVEKNLKQPIKPPEDRQIDDINPQICTKAQLKTPNNNEVQEEASNNSQNHTNTNIFNNLSIAVLVDEKLGEMEKRLIQKIEQVEAKTNQRFDEIIRLLETIKNPN